MDRRDALSRIALDGARENDRVGVAHCGDRAETEVLPDSQRRAQGAERGAAAMDHRTHNFGGAMEDKAGFDLNGALRRWRRGLAGRAGLQGENLEELESHLRESVATLEHSGL